MGNRRGVKGSPFFRKLYDRRGVGNNSVSFDGRAREERVAISPFIVDYKTYRIYDICMETGTTIMNAYAQYGAIGLIIIAFFVLVFWVLKTSEKREEKLYRIIDTLSNELPEIRHSLEEIKKRIFKSDE